MLRDLVGVRHARQKDIYVFFRGISDQDCKDFLVDFISYIQDIQILLVLLTMLNMRKWMECFEKHTSKSEKKKIWAFKLEDKECIQLVKM